MAKKIEKTSKKKFREKVSSGIAHIQSTFNNTIVTITNPGGNVLAWSSSGACGFKGARKKTPLAAKQAAERAAQICVSQGMKEITVRVKGAGAGREAALRGLRDAGLTITIIRDITPIPHNGCRPPKKRRV
jgi:small subunit ribosomal protein S11|uniref:Small ribosomal subunit protein uS11c n=1 Tax=Pseudochloris wilhelmii TaxID=1418016 RepID=A0A097KQT2_9CHLO|nr:ribosomal protein S11 [Pseudochloris wilhelmii]AIT95532.1 ribosomal protein S11 [Pseudochloris wilhelmii]